MPSTKQQSLILFGTQTGTAEDLSEELQQTLQAVGQDPRLENMFDISFAEAAEYSQIYIIVSTWGDGEPPDDAEDLYQEAKEAAAGSLNGVQFAVFGLGDTGYEQFCQCGIDFDQFFENAGARRMLDRVDADIDFEEDFEQWLDLVKNLNLETSNP